MRADHRALKNKRVPKMSLRPENFDDMILMVNVHKFDKDRIGLAAIFMSRYAVDHIKALELVDNAIEAIEENTARRKYVVSHMHHSGDNYKKLTSKEHMLVYYEADGYGYLRPAALAEINGGYDWSHIRDSTIDGWKRMEQKINNILKKKDREPETQGKFF